jgi:hypothetical protein
VNDDDTQPDVHASRAQRQRQAQLAAFVARADRRAARQALRRESVEWLHAAVWLLAALILAAAVVASWGGVALLVQLL